eukprot:6481867-Amphidinium_carterae.1
MGMEQLISHRRSPWVRHSGWGGIGMLDMRVAQPSSSRSRPWLLVGSRTCFSMEEASPLRMLVNADGLRKHSGI